MKLTAVDATAFDFGVERDAIAVFGGPLEDWFRVEPTDCHWDDLLSDASGFGPPTAGTRFEASLLALAESCQEVAIWYPNDEKGEIPVVDDPVEFAGTVTAEVGRGNIEPKLRFVRRPQTR